MKRIGLRVRFYNPTVNIIFLNVLFREINQNMFFFNTDNRISRRVHIIHRYFEGFLMMFGKTSSSCLEEQERRKKE